LAISLVAVSFGVPALSVKSQERKAIGLDVPVVPAAACPRALAVTLTAQNPPNVYSGDFSPAQLANQVGLNYTSINKIFLHTFQWRRDQTCCQVTKAVLTVRMRSNSPCTSANSPDAGNDGINIMHNTLSLYGEPVYSGPPPLWSCGVNQPAVKQWTFSPTVNPAILNNINTLGRLSFAVQDDTRVESATLQLSGCCLSTPRREAAEDITQASPN
jgi:hypothetical protein